MSAQTVNPLKKFKHPVRNFLLERDGRRDLAAIRDQYPALADLEAVMQRHSSRLADAHQHYITSVSVDYMAASLESSALICALAECTQSTRLMDLGSGFSSYALRSYARDANWPTSVVSVDDSAEWLAASGRFLSEHELDDSELHSWENSDVLAGREFDLIFHDMGDMNLRAVALPWVFERVRAGGFIVFDDMHKHRYHQQAVVAARAAGITLFSMRSITRDALGRFAVLGIKPGGAV